jgi:YidC/Oxa1 family membrane protein insertase
MERRLILTIALSLLVLLSWSAFISKTQPIVDKGVTQESTSIGNAREQASSAEAPLAQRTPSSLLDFSQDKFDIVFLEEQAAIKEVIFKDYKSGKIILSDGFLWGDAQLVFQKESFGRDEAVFVHRGKDREIIKRFIFHNSSYSIELEIVARNLSTLPLSLSAPLTLGTLDFAGDPNEARYQDVSVVTPEKTLRWNGRKNNRVEGAQLLSLRNRYFCAIAEPQGAAFSATVSAISKQESRVYLQTKEVSLGPGKSITQKFRIYLGPQDLHTISSIKPEWSVAMHYGTFNLIANILLYALGFIHGLVHNWGWTIVILSISVYFLLFPLTLKQMRSMKEMQALQPRIEELRKAYKDNPQRLNKEIMQLYREHKVNPMGGCLPLLLQIPVFFALYQVLMRSVVLKGANFLWIKDLSEPDRLLLFPRSLPILGNELNILPIIMAIQVLVQQKLSMSKATSSASAEQQKMMMIVFPVMFGLIFYKMPAGLVLYWFINSSLMLFYQWRIGRSQ